MNKLQTLVNCDILYFLTFSLATCPMDKCRVEEPRVFFSSMSTDESYIAIAHRYCSLTATEI